MDFPQFAFLTMNFVQFIKYLMYGKIGNRSYG
jgi:hypothetical protein